MVVHHEHHHRHRVLLTNFASFRFLFLPEHCISCWVYDVVNNMIYGVQVKKRNLNVAKFMSNTRWRRSDYRERVPRDVSGFESGPNKWFYCCLICYLYMNGYIIEIHYYLQLFMLMLFTLFVQAHVSVCYTHIYTPAHLKEVKIVLI